MGAGISKAQEYRIVYRELRRIQRELSAANVESTYKRRCLYHCPRLGNSQFTIQYRRQNASNGECCVYPVIALTDVAGNWEHFCDFERGRLSYCPASYKTGIARIIELFAGKKTWDSTRAAQ
jgi:hypothetical protein